MALIDNISAVLGFGGKDLQPTPGRDRTSTLHYQSSINNQPPIDQSPSSLDLDGETPRIHPSALKTSQLHVQDKGGVYTVKADHSTQDLDGKTPSGYKHPETGKTF